MSDTVKAAVELIINCGTSNQHEKLDSLERIVATVSDDSSIGGTAISAGDVEWIMQYAIDTLKAGNEASVVSVTDETTYATPIREVYLFEGTEEEILKDLQKIKK